MKLNSDETAVRVEGGWEIYDKWNQTEPTFVVADGIREREFLKSLYHNPDLNPEYKEEALGMYADTSPLMENSVHRIMRMQRKLLVKMRENGF